MWVVRLSMSDLEALADQLVEHRINGDFLPDTSLAAELDSHSDVFAVHERMMETGGSSALGEHVGWKVGATNEGMWSGMGLVEPLRAPIFASALSASPAVASKAADNLTVLEAEFAFKLKSPLVGTWAAPVTAEAAWDATEEVYLAIEICVCPAPPRSPLRHPPPACRQLRRRAIVTVCGRRISLHAGRFRRGVDLPAHRGRWHEYWPRPRKKLSRGRDAQSRSCGDARGAAPERGGGSGG